MKVDFTFEGEDRALRRLDAIRPGRARHYYNRAIDNGGHIAVRRERQLFEPILPRKEEVRSRLVWIERLAGKRLLRYTGAGSKAGRGFVRPRYLNLYTPPRTEDTYKRPCPNIQTMRFGGVGLVPVEEVDRGWTVHVAKGRRFIPYEDSAHDFNKASVFYRRFIDKLPVLHVTGPTVGGLARKAAIIADAQVRLGHALEEAMARMFRDTFSGKADR